MKHKHYEKIVAKAANTTLVKFVKLSSEWAMTTTDEWNITSDYFLCLPQHKEACLHWLNGGDVRAMDTNWINVFPVESYPWEEEHDFMCKDAKIRIKPKKEKRWIAVLPNGRTSGWHDDHTEELKKQYNESGGWQFIQIEVEV